MDVTHNRGIICTFMALGHIHSGPPKIVCLDIGFLACFCYLSQNLLPTDRRLVNFPSL
jgi:hypothetical protein